MTNLPAIKMMKKLFFLISILCFLPTFAVAQKTVRKRAKSAIVQTDSNQINQINEVQRNQKTSNSNQTKSEPFNTPVKILKKPRPQFADGQDCSQGKVVLRVKFLETGKIGEITVISGLTKAKTESAIEAARKIKFEPAMRNGVAYSVIKPVEYNFTIY